MTKRKALIAAGVAVVVLIAVALITQMSAMSYSSLMDALRAHGASVVENGRGSQPFLNGTDYRLTVNGAGIDVFEYRTALGASLDAARISSDGSTIGGGFGPFIHSTTTVDFIEPPHWFHAGRVLVLYVGRQSDVLNPLQAVLGTPFAGTSGTAPPPAADDYSRLLARLRAAGATVTELSARPSAGLVPTDPVQIQAHEVSVNGVIVTAFAFRDPSAAMAYEARISGGDIRSINGQGLIVIEYAAPPHFYRSGSVIMIYVGQDPEVLRLLTSVAGAPFAEGHF
jgi:hypothetical protein